MLVYSGGGGGRVGGGGGVYRRWHGRGGVYIIYSTKRRRGNGC